MTISVSQLNNYIHGIVDIDGILSNISVCGEVTNVKKSRDGWYFSLKDDQAAINCFCYDSMADPEVGSVVVAEGQVNYFVKNGSLSLFVRRLTATKNTGAAYLQFVQLKEKLAREGLFDENRKKIVPHCCNKIGIVTSETGAVIHDITNVALRRQPFVNLILYPVKVQGQGAASEITQGIVYFANTDVDVIIVGRGGGSNEDLSVFNDEELVRAVACSPKPVVSAVGHGIDYTLCDFAADKRAVTPSEAAEFVTIDVARTKFAVRTTVTRIENIVATRLQLFCKKVSYLLKNINSQTDLSFVRTKNRIISVLQAGQNRIRRQINENEQFVKADIARLNSLNPLNVLQRGYAYVECDGTIIKSVDGVEKSDKVTLTVADGKILAQVLAKEKK